MENQNLIPTESKVTNKPLLIFLGVLTLIGLGVVSMYFYTEYTKVIKILNSNIEVFDNSSSVEERSKDYVGEVGDNENVVSCPAPSVFSVSSTPTIPVLLYAEQIGETVVDNRSFPTFSLLKKVGDAEAMPLTQVGGPNEYPSQFVLSPDNTRLVIDLGYKLQMFDLQTLQKHDIFFSKENDINVVTFSPDGKELFVTLTGDETDFNVLNDVEFRILSLENCVDRVVYKEKETAGVFFQAVWREDDVVLLNKGYGEGQHSYLYNIKTREFSSTPGEFMTLHVSKSGKKAISIKGWIPSVCNDFSGQATGSYSIVEPISGSVLGIIEGNGNQVQIIMYSPDEEEILYTLEKLWEKREDCDTELEKTFYVKNIKTGTIQKIDDITKLLSTWKNEYIRYGFELGNLSMIYVNEKLMATSTAPLQIIGNYRQ